MDFGFTSEQRQLRQRMIEFAHNVLDADPAQGDRSARLDRAAWRCCAEFGILGWPVPTCHGGAGLDPLTIAIGLEALGYGCRDNGLVFALNNHLWACVSYVVDHGDPRQRERFLPGLIDGSLVGGQAMTEPEAGSDVLAARTVATRKGDTYYLNGIKTFISNAPVADLLVVFARTGEPGESGLTAFLVATDGPGIRINRSLEKCGLRSTEMGEVEFVDCPVSADCVLRGEGDGYRIFTATIAWERILMFASQLGVMERVLEDCVEHVNQRHQFGHNIGSYQAVSHRVADMKVGLELARLALYKAAWCKKENRIALLEAAIAKLVVSEQHLAAMLAAVRLHGARGYLTEFGMEREFRDSVAGTIYGGTSDIQRNIIASLIGVAG